MQQKHLRHHLPRAQAQETNHATTCAPSRALQEGGLLEKREVELWPRMVARELPLRALLHLLDWTVYDRTVYASCDHSSQTDVHKRDCVCLLRSLNMSLLCVTSISLCCLSLCLPLVISLSVYLLSHLRARGTRAFIYFRIR